MAQTIKGLQYLPIRLDDDAIATLAANTALILNQQTAFTRSYLVKQVQYNVGYNVVTGPSSVILGLANGTATITEIAAALNTLVIDPDDGSSPALLAQKSIIWWETLRFMGNDSVGNGAAGQSVSLNERISIGGGKGIPIIEDNGILVFVWNPTASTLSTASLMAGLIILKGVWLND